MTPAQGNWMLVVGQDQLIPKALYGTQELERLGVSTHFLTLDRSGFTRQTIDRYGVHATIAPRNELKHWLSFARLLRRLRPRHVELFFGVRPWTVIAYVVMCRGFKVPIVCWCRGSEILRNPDVAYHRRLNPLRRLARRVAFQAASVILLRELYMERVIRRHRLAPAGRLRLCPNSVPIPPEPPARREPLVLFLNRPLRNRNPLLFVDAAAIVHARRPEASFEIVGATTGFKRYRASDDAEPLLRLRVRELGLEDVVQIIPFTTHTAGYLERAAVFVLPADIVFCNHSLLEAMAMGVVPIVANVEGADRIVEHGVSGFIVEKDATQLASRILELLQDDALRQRMGAAAREKIRGDFNSATTARNLLQLYQRQVWR
jgi:glycosyltransferase involved in cell wall biosynthesis